MKPIQFYISCCFFVGLTVQAQPTVEMMTLLSDSRAFAINQYSIRAPDEAWTLWDNARGFQVKCSAYSNLCVNVATNWAELTSNWHQLVKDETDETILILSTLEMPADEYLHFLQALLPLTEQGVVNKQILSKVFLAYHYQDIFWTVKYKRSDVRQTLELAKRVFADDPRTSGTISGILSGQALQDRKEAIANGLLNAKPIDKEDPASLHPVLRPEIQLNKASSVAKENTASNSSEAGVETKNKKPDTKTSWTIYKAWIIGLILVVIPCGFGWRKIRK